MTDYIVTARKWRPMIFDDVVGQNHVTTTLRNAIQSNRLAHAYLFSGPRGVGKTTTARLLAKVVNCASPRDFNPDNECENCREITEGRSFDVLEIDGASNRGVDEIRNLREAVRYTPTKGHYRVYIIDEVHMLTKEAFNALLKTLEEPPPHVLFIFATTEIHKVPATILSRCQRFDFRRIATAEIAAKLSAIAEAEGVTIDREAVMLIARRGDGSLRDAQSIFDQVVSLCGIDVSYRAILDALHIVDQELFFRVTHLMKAKDAKGVLALVDELLAGGHDIREFLMGLMEHFRNILLAKTSGSPALIEASDATRARYMKETEAFTVTDLLRYQRFLAGTEGALRWSSQPRFRLEADMVQLILMPEAPEVAEILAGLDALKKKGLDGSQSGSLPVARPARKTTSEFLPAKEDAQNPVQTQQGDASRTVPAALPSLTLQEITARWAEFLAEVRSQRISLWSVLEPVRPIEVRGIVVKLSCPGEFQMASLARNRDILSELFKKVFGVGMKLEGIVETHGSSPPLSSNAAPPPEEPEHPIIAALKRELGAEPL